MLKLQIQKEVVECYTSLVILFFYHNKYMNNVGFDSRLSAVTINTLQILAVEMSTCINGRLHFLSESKIKWNQQIVCLKTIG